MFQHEKRLSDILGLISKLDISPYMYKDAVEKYKNIVPFYKKKVLRLIFGSFSS